MFVDASVIVAILAREPGSEEIIKRMGSEAGPFRVSPLVRFEATLALARKKVDASGADVRPDAQMVARAREAVEAFIAAIGADEIVISREIGDLAIEAAMKYGKAVGHAADLNFGDCFAYGCAKAHETGLLYKGNDFALTDLA